MRFLLVLALLAGCNKPSSTAGSDQLWSLTPAGARGAIVISPRGVAMLESGYAAVHALVESSPDFAVAKAQLAEWLAPVGGSALKLADFGFGPSRGAALFLMKEGMVAVLPVVDRDKFLARVRGTKGTDKDTVDSTTCKLVRGHYACASSEPLLATIGQGDLKKHLLEARVRGEIEIVGAELPYGEQPMVIAAAIQLARGAVTLRGTLLHPPAQLDAVFARTGTVKLDPTRTSGFAIVDLPAWLPNSQEPIVPDVTLERVLAALAGPMVAVVPAGVHTMNVEQPVTDPALLRTVVERCGELPDPETIEAKYEGGVCHFKAPSWGLALDTWMDGNTLRMGAKTNPPQPKPVPMTPLGAELARGTWSLAFWGRGTMLAGPPKPGVEPVDVAAESALAIRVMSLLTEIGFGVRKDGERLHVVAAVRTLFSNPDPVLAKLFAITANDIAATRTAALAAPIATSSPHAPFAHDFAAGHTGLLLPTALAGVGTSMLVQVLMLLRQHELAAPDEAPVLPPP